MRVFQIATLLIFAIWGLIVIAKQIHEDFKNIEWRE